MSKTNANHDDNDNKDLDKESIRKINRDQAQRIFDFLSKFLTIYNKQQRKYIKSFAKHVYRWARISSHHSEYFDDKTNDKKIQTLMNQFSDQFNKKYLPPIENNSYFYEIYPSKELKELVKRYKNKLNNNYDSKNISINTKKENISQNCAENANVIDTKTVSKKHKCNVMNDTIPRSIQNTPKRVRPQKVLLLMDFDDTLIPSKMLKLKNYQITFNKLTYTERRELDGYTKSLNAFMDTMLSKFDDNIDGNVQILTNGSSNWVTEESMWNSGKLFAQKMVPFMKKMTECKIDIISALDNWKLNCHKYEAGFQAIEPHKWKWICMKQLIRQYFGRKLKGDYDVKIISMGDSYWSEFLGAADAFKYYLRKQKLNTLKSINISLHRIKFIEEPTWNELNSELKWMKDNIDYIINNQHKSADYIMENILKVKDGNNINLAK